MLKTQAYDHIRKKIFQGELKPGDPISARAIAREVGSSFIPVREALARLAADGLVDHTSGVGCFVAAPDRQDILDMYQFRALLEGFAAEQTGRPGYIDTTPEMQRANEDMRKVAQELIDSGTDEWSAEQVDRWIAGDREFHRELLRAAGNRIIVDAAERVRHMLAWTWSRRAVKEILLSTCDFHDRIVDALRRGEGLLARSLVIEHIQRGGEGAIKGFESHRLRSTTR